MSGGIFSRATSTAFSAPPAPPTSSAMSGRDRRMQPPVPARSAEDDGRQPHHRSDRQVDAAGDDDRRQRDRQQPELHAEARDLEEVPGGGEVRRDGREERDLGRQCDEQDRVTGWEALEGPDHGVGEMRAQCQQVGRPQRPSLSKSFSPQSSQRTQSNNWLCVLSALRGERLLDSEGRWRSSSIWFNAPRDRKSDRVRHGPIAQGVERHGGKNDRALNRALPVGADAEKRQRRTDRAEQDHAEHRAGDAPAPAADRGAADDDGGDDLQLETEAGVAGNLVEADRIEQRREPGQAARQREYREGDEGGVKPGQARRFAVRAGRIDRAAGREMARAPTRGER